MAMCVAARAEDVCPSRCAAAGVCCAHTMCTRAHTAGGRRVLGRGKAAARVQCPRATPRSLGTSHLKRFHVCAAPRHAAPAQCAPRLPTILGAPPPTRGCPPHATHLCVAAHVCPGHMRRVGLGVWRSGRWGMGGQTPFRLVARPVGPNSCVPPCAHDSPRRVWGTTHGTVARHHTTRAAAHAGVLCSSGCPMTVVRPAHRADSQCNRHAACA